MQNYLILHGVNLNMFGRRDKSIYGAITLPEIDAAIEKLAGELGVGVTFFQSNHEGEMVERIHKACDENLCGAVINAGAWTHYSLAIADALAILSIPVVETHLSNIHARENFRHHSVFSKIVAGSICGFGPESYLLALRACVYLANAKK